MKGNALTIWKKYNGIALKIAGLAAVWLLSAVLVYYWRVFYYLDARGVAWPVLTAAVAAVGTALYAVCLAAARWVHGFAGRAAVCLAVCGLLYVFCNPPLQVPDETSHFLRSYSISQGHLDFDADRVYPEDVSRLVEAFPGAWVNAHTSSGMRENDAGEEAYYTTAGYALKQYGEDGAVQGFADGFARYFSGEPAEEPAAEPLNLVIFPYLAAAAGIALARLVGFSALGCFYAGRIANLLVYVLLAWLALRRLKRFRPMFLAVLALPMSLYMAASYNYDAILLGCYAWAATWFFTSEAEPVENRDLAAFLAVFLVMNAIKPWINLLWLAALWCVPKKNWKARLPRWALALAAVAAAVCLSRFVDWYGVAMRVNYPEIGRQMEGADMLGQLRFVLANPLRYLAVLAGTLYENRFFVGQLGLFGALDLPIEAINLLSPLALLLGAVLSAPDAKALRPRRAAGLGAWALVYGAGAITAMYITWTPVGMVRVIGLQARYFLPVFLLLGAACAVPLDRVLVPQTDGTGARRAALGAGWLLAVLGALLLWQHCFIGPVYTI